MSLDVTPVILCGGAGTRLWPVSRPDMPKQFHALVGDDSLLTATIKRAQQIASAPPIVVSGAAHGELVAAELAALGIADATVILEPCARNTAAAVALAARHAANRDADATLWIMPADHLIGDDAALADAVARAAPVAATDRLVTFGIVPREPHTGYGYIRRGPALADDPAVCQVAQFVEKPDRATAEAWVASGEYAWNSGMFVFRAATFLDELAVLAPEIHAAAVRAIDSAHVDRSIHPDADAFAAAPSVAIDVAVMEKTARAVVVDLNAPWTDVGSWAALWEYADKDGAGNVGGSAAVFHDAANCLVHSEAGGGRGHRTVAMVGVDDIVVVETPDAILVCRRDRSQDVREVIAELERRGGN